MYHRHMKTFDITMVQPQGYCGGVLKAISIAKNCRQEHPDEKITILGNLVHNQYVQQALEYYKINTIDNKNKTRIELLDEISDGIVIFTAHGVSKDVYAKAQQKNLTIVDATCPFVAQTQKIVSQKCDEGYTILYIGKDKHPEAEGIYAGNEHVILIQDENIPDLNTDKIFVTNQTTMSMLDIQSIFKKIKEKYPHAIIHDEICNATRVRQQAILDLEGKGFDILVVVGDPTSNNTAQLAKIGKLAGIPHIIKAQTVQDIDLMNMNDHSKIAITSGASTPTYLTNQIYEYLQTQDIKKEIRISEIL